MDVEDKGNHQIEVGLSAKDKEELFMKKQILSRDIFLGSQVIRIHAFPFPETNRDRMVPEEERMPAEVKYASNPPYVSETVVEERQKRDKIYAKRWDNGDIDVYMSELTAMCIHHDGIIEIKAQMPQILKEYPDNYVKIFVKTPF